MALIDNIVSYWKLDESSGNAADEVSSNTLINNGTATYSAGKINNAVNVESGKYLSIADGSQTGLDLTGDMTINLWVNFSSLPTGSNEAVLVGKWTAASRAYMLFFDTTYGGDLYSNIGTGASTGDMQNSVTWEPNTNTWYMVTLRYTDSTKKVDFSINGSAQGTQQSVTNNLGNGSGPFEIGTMSNLSWPMTGSVDEVGVWSRRLTDAELTTLCNSGDGLAYPFIIAPTIITVTIQTKAKIQTTGITKTITSKARIEISKSKIIQAKANLLTIQEKSIQTKTNLLSIINKNIQAKARIKILAVSYAIQSKARIELTESKTIQAKARIEISKSKIIQAKANLKATNFPRLGSSVQYNGIDAYADCGSDDSLNLTTALSFECWVRPMRPHEICYTPETGGNAGIAAKVSEHLNSSTWSWQLRFGSPDSCRIGMQFNQFGGGTVWVTAKEDLTVGDWYHLVITYDGINARFYLNTALKDTQLLAGIVSNLNKLLFASDGWSSVTDYFKGNIDEVRLYDRALSQQEIQEHYGCVFVNETGLVGFWKHDENIGDTIIDNSPNTNNATIYNDIVWERGAPKLICFKANIFNATNQNIQTKTCIFAIVEKAIQANTNLLSIINKSIQAKAIIELTESKTMQAKARIEISKSKTIQTKANLLATLEKSIQAKANILSTINKDIQAKARIKILAVGYIIQSLARIEKVKSKSIQAKTIIEIGRSKTINALANIKATQEKLIQAKANILSTINKDIQAKARIKILSVSYAIQALARIKQIESKSIQAKAIIKISKSKTIQTKTEIHMFVEYFYDNNYKNELTTTADWDTATNKCRLSEV